MTGLLALAYDKPLWAVGLALLLLMLVARGLGAALKRRLERGHPEDLQHEQDEGHIVAAVLGLLALLIAFTFGLALNRFETRRELVVKEARALDAAYLRAAMLDDPESLRQTLRTYTAERVRYGSAPIEDQLAAEARAKPREEALWNETMTAVAPIKGTAAGIFVSTPVNEAIDAALERRAVLAARLPKSVLNALITYAIVSAAILGYAVPGYRGRHWITSLVLFGLISMAIVLILDLDRPRNGAIRIPQTPMEEALAAMSPK